MTDHSQTPTLEVAHLSVDIATDAETVHPVDDISLTLHAGETLGIVGESGSGKSMTGLAIMGLLPGGGHITSGTIRLAGRDLVGLSEAQYQHVRGADIAMIFQDSMTSLNPTRTIGAQVAEPLRVHRGASRRDAGRRAEEMLELVGIPDPRQRMYDYPHQLSGGQRQRVMIAMALMCGPKVLIADEPTTALDVTIQDQILTLLDRLKTEMGMAMLLVTHDMGVIATRADRTMVMYAGRIAEVGDTETVLRDMRHPYTQALLASIPTLGQDRASRLYSIPGNPPDLAAPLAGCPFAPRCAYAQADCLTKRPMLRADADPEAEMARAASLAAGRAGRLVACWHEVAGPLTKADAGARTATDGRAATVGRAAMDADRTGRPGADESQTGAPLLSVQSIVKDYPAGKARLFGGRRDRVHAVASVSFDIHAGETVGLVGESGSGKTTLGRIIAGLLPATAGSVWFDGDRITGMRTARLRALRRDLQMMFQDPFESLDPHLTIGEILREPLRIQSMGSRRDQLRRVDELLDEVSLRRDFAARRPHELSGGQRQRVGVARAWALRPKLIVADEPVSALDASVRSQVLNLMRDLQARHQLTYIVISHDLTVVRYMADRVAVMNHGALVEIADSNELFTNPRHPYTAELIASIPTTEPARS